jgi:hypothetical protein
MENKGPKKISAKEIVADLKEGLSDGDLLNKYGISYNTLQDLFGKLVDAGLASKAYFNKRAFQQARAKQPSKSSKPCPYCGYSSEQPFKKCPRCHQDGAEWLDTAELTDILTGSFD